MTTKSIVQIALGAALFMGGMAAGSLHARSAAAQNRFGQPKTVLHVVIYKFKDTTSNYDRENAINGIKEMAAKIPGIKNVWLKTERNQIKDFSGVYAIEFTSAEAAADYSESPLHEAWSKKWQELRENSLSFQISNP
ncbi:MAG: Dabb family protein [Candidatus Acidiferrum sp.]